MRNSFLPFSPPTLGAEEVEGVVDTLRSDWITTGPKTVAFEQALAKEVNAPAALALNSCTAALHTALVAMGVGAGETVATTPMTFCSTVHVIEHTGATPLLVDVEPDTLNLDPRQLVEAANGADLRAVLPVHFAGQPCDMDPILDVAAQQGAAVVEDAAHALPAAYRGRRVGEVANTAGVERAVAFSFYATKNVTTAEGGMLTGTEELIDSARVWSLHGMSKDAWRRYTDRGSWFYDVVEAGFKYNMTDIAAALGLGQLHRLGEFDRRRHDIAARYSEAFAGVAALEPPTARADVHHAWHLYVLRLHLDELSIDRNAFINELQDRRIGVSVHFIPVHLHTYYRERYGWRPEDFPVAYEQYQRMVSLPIYPSMTNQDVEDVIEAVTQVATANRRRPY
jgi:dTDP-4-amino-4,6-dideoxygalactose transaminase